MAVVLDLVTDALGELGVLAAGEVATADDGLSGLRALNQLVDQWAAERLTLYTLTDTDFALTANQSTYTIGAGVGANFVAPRPVYIDHLNLLDTSPTPDLEIPLQPLTDDMWAGITNKAMTSLYPSGWWYNPTFPNGTIEFWPIPTSTTLRAVIYTPTATSQFASLSTTVSLPPGYERMIVKNLAMELAPSYEREVSATLARQAIEAKSVVKVANKRLSDLSFDGGALIGWGGGWSIYTGP